ncbi:hypothetical protein [Pararhodobacter sp. CCB-MM2]|uniref:hypothetical protein n=1 Tax=Pararhodobacter sp. CCB-MM2 TaxID=1786003 RepID=UPI00082FC843|nr:hypothetical protein [Pararhodobacter sp. CCB-MM2]
MSIGQNAIGADFTTPETLGSAINVYPSFELGTRMKGANGSEWVYVQADGAITGAGYVVVIDEAWQAAHATNTTAVYGQQIGVAGAAFADNDYGWVQVFGTANIRVAASCAANAVITSTTTAGQLDDAAGTGTKTIVGAVLTTANGGAAATAEGVLTYPTVGATN